MPSNYRNEFHIGLGDRNEYVNCLYVSMYEMFHIGAV